ncbi:hypothetical protein J7M23_02015 [Candidatus Sumerlaeota bacterium]|nr:hypothetical protein [Candidatus Sumerlaeota bacterium]
MKVRVDNKSSFCSQAQKLELETSLNRLLSNEAPSELIVPIEIRDTPSLFSKLLRFLGTRSLRSFASDGEVILFPRKIILYKRAFKGGFKRLMHIALHEIGHYLDFDYRSRSDREKRADMFAEKFGYGH